MDDKDKAATPLVDRHEKREADEAPQPVDTGAPVSTDKIGATVDHPDLGGRID